MFKGFEYDDVQDIIYEIVGGDQLTKILKKDKHKGRLGRGDVIGVKQPDGSTLIGTVDGCSWCIRTPRHTCNIIDIHGQNHNINLLESDWYYKSISVGVVADIISDELTHELDHQYQSC